jgi:thiol-disulfide isomerase/thioredoxin
MSLAQNHPYRVSLWLLVVVSSFFITSCGKGQPVPNASPTMLDKFPPERAALAKEIEDVGNQHIHMPPLPLTYAADRYIHVTPEYLRDSLKGKVVLIDIWDYTCINCIQTLPYIKAWNDRYKDKGLVMIGVHSPEFDFEKDPKNLDSAVQQFGLDYPIIADNDYEIWNSLTNQYWPAKYLFDKMEFFVPSILARAITNRSKHSCKRSCSNATAPLIYPFRSRQCERQISLAQFAIARRQKRMLALREIILGMVCPIRITLPTHFIFRK